MYDRRSGSARAMLGIDEPYDPSRASKYQRYRNRVSRCLRRRIEEAGLTQRELARRAGLAESTVSQYLQAKREPTLLSLRALADALGCPADDLLPGRDDDAPERGAQGR